MTFDAAFLILMPFEGGDTYTENPNDLGKGTKFGISAAAYPNLDIKNLTEEQAKGIYYTDYWVKGNCQKLKPELQYVHFDSCVQHGIENAIKILQKSCGASIDGKWGSETLTKSDGATIDSYLFYRILYYCDIVTKNPSQLCFFKGWTNRLVAIKKIYLNGDLS